MKKVYNYVSLEDTIRQIKKQAIDSIPYCYELTALPFNTLAPDELFYYLKGLTTYKKDPPNVELLQSAQTLFEHNKHGLPGYGDCDCFTILSLACLHCIGENNLLLILAGNTVNPSHVYAGFIDKSNKLKIFDLCQDVYNKEKKYKYYQYLPVKLK